MSARGGTGSKSTGRRLDEASTQFKRPIPDSDYEEPTGPSPKRRKVVDKPNLANEEVQADKDHNTLRNVRNRDIHEGVATVPHRVEETRQVLAAILAACTAVGDQADLGQPIRQEITMYGGTGGNGGNGGSVGIGGGGGVGEGPRILIDNFSGTQFIFRFPEVGGQVNPGIGRIMEGLATIWDGVAEVGGQFRSFMNDLLQWIRPVPRGVSDHLFWVMDPEGMYIPVSLLYCHNYPNLDDILKGYLRRRPQAGGRYVERGDYSIVSADGSFIVPAKFARTVKPGIVLEISILQWQVRNQSDTIQNTTCLSCGCSQATTTENGWFKCTTCARNYRMDGQDQDLEEIVSPQLAQPNGEAERKLFRRVHIRILHGNMMPMINPNVNAGSMNSAAMPLPPAPPSATDGLFSDEFIQSAANELDEFVDIRLFRGDGNLNFERDFGQWFNPDDVAMDLSKQ